jgi:hypothetical protein
MPKFVAPNKAISVRIARGWDHVRIALDLGIPLAKVDACWRLMEKINAEDDDARKPTPVLRKAHSQYTKLKRIGEAIPGELAALEKEYHRTQKPTTRAARRARKKTAA